VSSRISGGLANVKADIADVLKEAASRICCTTDGWTSISMESYIVVTAHFLTHDWKMQGLVIAFDGMEESHTGENLAKRFVAKSLRRLGSRTKSPASSPTTQLTPFSESPLQPSSSLVQGTPSSPSGASLT